MIGRLETWIEGGSAMDELVRDLVKRAGLSEAQAKATAEVLVDWLRHEDRRKKILAAAVASMVASGVV